MTATASIPTTMAGMIYCTFLLQTDGLTESRFTDHEIPYEEQKSNLTLLMQSYLASMADLGAETWIIHGTLLGWWWNRKARLQKLHEGYFVLMKFRFCHGTPISMCK